MICKKCGYEIPKHLMGGAILTCPTCGYRYHKRPTPSAPSTKPAPRRPAIGMPFRLARTIIGILSLVAFIFVMFQSCAANVVNAMEANTADASAGGGVRPAYCGHYNGSGAR